MSDIVERLKNYNPPDRTSDDQRQIAVDIAKAANEIDRLERVNAELRERVEKLADEAGQHLLRANYEQGKRLAAEAERDALREQLAAVGCGELVYLRAQLERIAWHELTWREARDIARSALKMEFAAFARQEGQSGKA